MAKKNEEDEMTSSTTVLTVFMFIFAAYYVIRFFLADNFAVKKNSVMGIPLTILAFAIVFLFQMYYEIFSEAERIGLRQSFYYGKFKIKKKSLVNWYNQCILPVIKVN